MIRAVGIAVIAAFVSFVLGELGFRGKKLFSVVCTVLLFLLLGEGFSKIFKDIFPFLESSGISDAALCGTKIIGAGYIFGITADILSELGEPLLAKGLSAIGRIEILLIVFPYLLDIINLGIELVR